MNMMSSKSRLIKKFKVHIIYESHLEFTCCGEALLLQLSFTAKLNLFYVDDGFNLSNIQLYYWAFILVIFITVTDRDSVGKQVLK